MNIFIFSAMMAILTIIIFLILHLTWKAIYRRLKIFFNEKVDPKNILPEEEIKNQKQLFYLAIILLCIINLFYLLECHGFLDMFLPIFGINLNLTNIFYGQDINFLYFEAMDIILSLLLSLNLNLKKHDWDKIIFLILVPFGSLETFISLFFNNAASLTIFLDIIHILGILYFIKFCYKRFMVYTKNNALGRTILLFFVLLVFTVITIIITEKANILDSLNMFTNAFASNGFAVLGTSALGKINEMLIVWGGYILSGVGTASLTAAIIVRHFNYKLEEYDDMNKRFDELEEMIKNKKAMKKSAFNESSKDK